ncbi:hypothetical protein CsSME_00019723 [Camellia sinensis var. sinensis]
MKLTKYLENAKGNDELDVHLTLISLDKQSTASSKQLYLCCPHAFLLKASKNMFLVRHNYSMKILKYG